MIFGVLWIFVGLCTSYSVCLVQSIFKAENPIHVILSKIDFFHSIPLLVTLSLAGGYKVNAKPSLMASFSHILFKGFGWN